jgi:uncharacterized membrane protein
MKTKNKIGNDFNKRFILNYQYAIGLIIGLLYGWYAQEKVIGFIILIIFLVFVERFFR